MTLTQAVYEKAAALAGTMTAQQEQLLKTLCDGAVAYFTARLKEGVTQDSCREVLITAASLYALEGLDLAGGQIQEFRAGDLTVKQGTAGGSKTSRVARIRALMAPYCKDSVCFLGV